MPFEVVQVPTRRPDTLRVTGDLDIVTAPELAAAVTAALATAPPALHIDLTGTTFLDSSGARQLVLCAREAAGVGTSVEVHCPRSNTAVWLVIDLLDLGVAVPVVDPTADPGDTPAS